MEAKLLNVTSAIEKQVDAAIEQIDNLDSSDLNQLRKNRMKELQKEEELKKEWLGLGHGTYEELPAEKDFFDIIKKSDNLVLHFYRDSTERCLIVDKHLRILAPKHLEARFVKLNAEKSPFLAKKLKIKMIPTIVSIHKLSLCDKIIGFTELGNRDDFTTELLEWRLAQGGILKYEGDCWAPLDKQPSQSIKGTGKKIRDSVYNNGSDFDDSDIEEYGLEKEKGVLDKLTSPVTPVQSTELTAEELAELGLDD